MEVRGETADKLKEIKMSGKQEKKMRKIMKQEANRRLDARGVRAFALDCLPREEVAPQAPAEPPMSPEEKELTRLYKTFATTAWRMRNVLFDTETGEPKEELSDRSISRLAKYLESIEGALEDAHVQVKGDYVGMSYDEGDAVKVITFEERQDLSRDEYVETLTPTIRWTDKDGKTRLLQQAEVVVGKAAKK